MIRLRKPDAKRHKIIEIKRKIRRKRKKERSNKRRQRENKKESIYERTNGKE